jgi:hypothetical protein
MIHRRSRCLGEGYAMTHISEQSANEALAAIRTGLEADGYALQARELENDRLEIEISATPEACEDCLVPKPVMTQIVASTLNLAPGQIQLRYPGE